MLAAIHPKLPMRNREASVEYYINQLGFNLLGPVEYPDYLMVKKDNIEIHFFLYETLDPKENYGQVYIRVIEIESLYQSFLDKKITIHPNAPLTLKPWRQKEFSLLDPDNNLLTFGESI